MDQPKQLSHSHGFFPQGSSNLTDGADWQEEVYRKITQMKEQYYFELCEMYQRIVTKFQQHDSLPQPQKSEQLEMLRMLKTMLERFITALQVSKNCISRGLKSKLPLYEKQIISFINSHRHRKPVSFLDNPPQPGMQSARVLQQPKVEQQESNESETMDTSGADWQAEVYQKTQNLTTQMQHLSLQQQSHLLLQNMQQRLQQLYTMRQNQPYQSQGALLEKSSNSLAQTGDADWQEEAYQKIKVMKQLYFPKLSDMYWKTIIKLQQEDSYVQNQFTADQHANLNMLKNILERVIPVLHFCKADISVGFMETLASLEQHILTLLNTIIPDIL